MSKAVRDAAERKTGNAKGVDVPIKVEDSNNASLGILSSNSCRSRSNSCRSHSNSHGIQSSRNKMAGIVMRWVSVKSLLASMRGSTPVLIVLTRALPAESFCCGVYASGS